MAMGRSTVLGRLKSHPERRQITTVPYALTMRSGIGGFHFHPRRSGGGCKPDVPPRAHTTLQNPISRSLSWTLFVGPRAHAGPPPVMGASYSRRPIAAPSFCAITTAVTAIRRATQNAIIRFQTTEESRVECVLSCRRKWWRAGPVHPHCRATRAPASSNQQMPSHALSSPRAQVAAPPVVRLIHNKGPAAAASLKILITVTTMIKRVTQNNVIISLRTTDRMKRVLSCRRKRRRVGQACQVCRAMRAVTPSHPCSSGGGWTACRAASCQAPLDQGGGGSC